MRLRYHPKTKGGTNIKRWIPLFIVVFAVTIFRAMLQAFMPSSNNPLPPSMIVQAGLIPIGFMLFGLITFGLLAIVFVLVQDGLPGTRIKKGLVFGILFGVMWAVYLLEPLPHTEGLSLFDIFAYPLADSITILFLGLLLGRFIATDSVADKKAHVSSSSLKLLAISVMFLMFVAGRLLSYNIIHIYSSYSDKPFETMIWAAATGLWIGIMYLLLESGINKESPLSRAAYFALVVFGIDYFLFNLFLPLVFSYQLWPVGALLSYADLLVRCAIDIIFVGAGVYIFEIIKQKNRMPGF